MQVELRNPTRTLEFDEGMSVAKLLNRLGVDPGAVLVVCDGVSSMPGSAASRLYRPALSAMVIASSSPSSSTSFTSAVATGSPLP